MISYTVANMRCGHCVKAVTRAVQGVDPDARVEIDLTLGRVSVDGRPGIEISGYADAIRRAGYQVSDAS